ASCCDQRAGGEGYVGSQSKRRMSMRALNKAILWFVTAVAMVVLFFPSYIGTFLGSEEISATPNQDNKTQTVFQIEGMTCPGCAATVAQAIRSIPGVQSV